MHVKKITSIKVGVGVFVVYAILTAVMVYFKIKFVMFLVSILALLSLTTSYFIPTLYKIYSRRPVEPKGNQGANEDMNIDLDYGDPLASVKLDKQDKMMQDYFTDYKGNKKRTRMTKANKSNGLSSLLRVVLNFTLIVVIIGFYGLIIFNLAYHIVKPYID